VTDAQALRAARALIENIEHWARDQYAYTADDVPCGPNNPEAYCWCATGALYRALGAPVNTTAPQQRYLDAAALDLGYYGIVHLNDHDEASRATMHSLVLACYDQAIETAEKAEATA
jgi:hypothetical protein